jgi:hypothetical protein
MHVIALVTVALARFPGSGADSVIALADEDAEELSTGDGPAAGRSDRGVLAGEVLKITI